MASPLRPDADASPFVHPGDALDNPPLPFGEQISALVRESTVQDLFVRLLADCLPVADHYKRGRRWRAGYHRMVALSFVVCPELFDGMSAPEVAKEIGCARSHFFELVASVKIQLTTRAQTACQRAVNRSR